ncbi:YybH family protein [Bacteroidota bacterium]
MKRIVYLIIFSSIFIFNSCTNHLLIKENESKILLETDIEFSKTSMKLNAAEAFKLFLAEDAIQLPHNNFPILGREEIYESMKSESQSFKLEWEPQKAEVSMSGDLGWTWGYYKLSYSIDNETKHSYGKYLNVWKKQDDGSWKVVADLGNQNPEPDKIFQ